MISTVSDFLDEFRNYALAKIESDEGDIKHRPTIGNMFEGLTSEILNRSVFEGLDLRIVQNSFIYNDSGNITDELDCLLVVGGGEKISFTNQFKYHIKDVIAVFQVKKNLFGKDLDDAYSNLRSVIDVSEPRDAEPYVRRLHRDGYRALTGQNLPSAERIERFRDRENIAYHLLMMEAFHPLRIVIGYYGYKTLYGLREGFVQRMEEVIKEGLSRGYGPVSFPHLYICGNNSIIKNNGMPMGIPFSDEEFYWHILTTSNVRPMLHLLELIWTRLSYKFEISSSIFGEDLDVETTQKFLSCKERKLDNEQWGWEYFYYPFTEEQLNEPLPIVDWEPAEIDRNKFSLLNVLSKVESVDINRDKDFIEFIHKNKIDKDKILRELIEARLIYLDEGRIGLLTDDLLMSIAPDGKVYAGDNKDTRMTNYLKKKYWQPLTNDKLNEQTEL